MRRSFGIGGMWHNSVSECLPHDYSGEYIDDACLFEALMIPASVVSLKFVSFWQRAITCSRIRQNSDASGNSHEFRYRLIQ